MHIRLALTAALLAVGLIPAAAVAAPSDLDPTFGDGGVATAGAGRVSAQGSPIVQADGRVLAVGVDGASGRAVITRFTTAGTADPSFGAGGEVITDLVPFQRRAAVAATEGGGFQIAVGSPNNGSIVLGRFTAAGAMLSKTRVDVSGGPVAVAGAVARPDGSTYVAAKFDCNGGVYCTALLRIKGSGLDTTFANKGYRTLKIGAYTEPRDLAVTTTAAGKDVITVVGSANRPETTSADTTVIRYTHAGALDTSFDGDGIKTVDFTGNATGDWANGVVVAPTGAVTLAGAAGAAGYVARLTPTGAADPAFAAAGIRRGGFAPDGSSYVADHLVMDAAGRMVIDGATLDPTTQVTKWTASRLTAAGAFDADFAPTGSTRYLPCANTQGNGPTGIALGSRRIHIAGNCGADGRVAVARLVTVPPFDGPATLTLSVPAEAAGHQEIDTSKLDPSSVLRVVEDLASAPLRSNPLRSNPLRSNPLRSNPLRSNPLRSNPLRSNAIASTILLSDLPLVGTTWEAVLAGAIDRPLQTITLADALASGAPGVDALTLADVDLARTPLRDVTAGALLLGLRPLSALPAPAGGWCEHLSAKPLNCANGVDPGSTTLVDLELGGDDLSDYYAAGVGLAGADLGTGDDAAPLTYIGLVDVELSLTPFGDLPAERVAAVLDCADSCSGTVADQQAADPSGFSSATLGDLIALLPVQGLEDVTLGQMLRGLVAPENIPFERAPAAKLLALAEFRSERLQHATVGFTVDCAQTQGLAVAAQPADDARVVPGSATLTVGDSTAPVAGAGPFDLSGACGARSGSITPRLEFDVEPGSDLGPTDMTVRVASAFGELTAAAHMVVDDSLDPGDDLDHPRTLPGGRIVTGHIADAADVDFYRFPAPPAGSRVSFVMSHLPADYDLTVLGPPDSLPTAPLRSNPLRSNPLRSNPVTDSSREPVEDGAAPDTLQDIPLRSNPLRSNPLRSNSINRGTVDESATVVTTASDQGRDLLVAVTPFSGANHAKPYFLTAKVTPAPPAPPCAPQPPLSTGEGHGLPADVPADTRALILVNEQRLAAAHGPADAAAVAAKAAALADATDGLVVPLDVPATATEYAALDADPCSVAAANGVVTAVNGVVDTIRERGGGLPELRSILLVGSDRIVPQARVGDHTVLSNEADYALDSVFRGSDNGISRAQREGFLLTDDPYGDFDPGPDLYVPDVALGRLVEHPADIVGQIDAFLDTGGRVDPGRSFVTGYDFLSDGAQRTYDVLQAAAAGTLLQDSWTADQARDGANAAGASFTSINGHYDHYRALPGAGRLLGAGEVDPPAGSVMFTVGCHSGLNVDVAVGAPDADEQQRLADWPERMSANRALYTANTGYGYGDTESVAYSEKLMADYAEQLASGVVTAGQGLMIAKQLNAATLTATDDYWNKASMGATFYGIPMYRVGAEGREAAPSVPEPPSGAGALRTSSAHTLTPSFVEHATGRGRYWTADGHDPLVVQHRAIQPRTTLDVTQRDAAPVHGVVIEALETSEQDGVDHVIARPTVDLAAHEPEPGSRASFFPAQLATVLPAQTETGRRDLLTLAAGQARGGVQRFVERAVVRVYRSNSSDYEPNVITRIDGLVAGGAYSISVDVLGGDEDGGVILFRTDADATWHSVALAKVAPGRLGAGGALPAGASEIAEAMVWVRDVNGNTAFSNSKVVGYSFEPVRFGAGDPRVVFSPDPPASGYYSTPPTVSLNPGDHAGARFEYSVDGGPWQLYDDPFTMPAPAEGEHVVRVRGSDGSAAANRFAVDNDGPTVSAEPTTAPNLSGWYREPVTVRFTCADAVSGVASCPGAQTLSGDGRDQSASGTATDRAGHSGSGSVTGINIDRTPPAIAGTPDRPANADGWYQDPVTVRWTCEDALSGVDTCAEPVTIGEAQDASATGEATDIAGNVATASVDGLRVDRNPPRTTITSPGLIVLEPVRGTAKDLDGTGRSGIKDVEVVYTQGTRTIRRSVGDGLTLTCNAGDTDCTWAAQPPGLGTWTVQATSYDRSGRASAAALSTLSVNP